MSSNLALAKTLISIAKDLLADETTSATNLGELFNQRAHQLDQLLEMKDPMGRHILGWETPMLTLMAGVRDLFLTLRGIMPANSVPTEIGLYVQKAKMDPVAFKKDLDEKIASLKKAKMDDLATELQLLSNNLV